ncbi:MAG: phosphopantetheine adenylyltransferase [Gammaproteobacteria bacterium]
MRFVLSALLIVSGIIHLLPLSGVAGSRSLSVLYGITVDEPNIAILMRHRAVLFGLLGLLLIWAAFDAGLQLPALALGLISVVSFLWLAQRTGGYNPQLRRVYQVDLLALFCLLAASLIWITEHII